MSDSAEPARPWLVHGSLVLVQVFFGLHYLAAKVILTELEPRAWAALRAIAAAALLLLAAKLLHRKLPSDRPTLVRLALLALLGVVVNQLCFVEGLARTTATHSSLLNTTIPVSTLLFALVIGQEKLELSKLFPLGVAYGGVLLVIRPWSSALPAGGRLGDGLTLVNALSYSLFLVLSKRVLARTDALGATAMLLSFGALGLLVPGLPALVDLDPGRVSLMSWGLGLGIVLFPTAGAYLLTYWALSRVESSAVAFFVYLQPIIAASLAVVLLGERLERSVILGAVLIFAGVYLVLRPQAARRRAAPPS